jgi:hypothetical protein
VFGYHLHEAQDYRRRSKRDQKFEQPCDLTLCSLELGASNAPAKLRSANATAHSPRASRAPAASAGS